MLFTRLLPRALSVSTTTLFTRTMASSAIPPTSFTLNRSLFNETLYAHLRDFWFAGMKPTDKAVPPDTAKRWFGAGLSEQERAAFDSECRSNFGPALDSISPAHIALPPFKSHDDDFANASALTAPFLHEVQTANTQNSDHGTETLLSLILLLDQMPRNIHRDPAGLRLVYTHYDRLAWSLVRAASHLQPNPIKSPTWTARPVYMTWLALPLMHAEDLTSHDLADEFYAALSARAAETGDEDAMGMLSQSSSFLKSHREIIEQFGRYPHRNECLDRKTGEEEAEWLKTGDTFGVKQGSGAEKDEKEEGKEEL